MNNIDYFATYDLPVPYKNLKLYPVTVKDALLFNAFSQCLQIDKNSMPDAKIISMTYLEYIYYATQQDMEKTPYLFWFDRLLSMCLKNDKSFEKPEVSIKRYRYDKNKKPFFVIENDTYNSKDFDEIKDIICEQNYIELPDENISKEVRDSLEKAKAYKAKVYNSKYGTLEDIVISLSVATGWTFEYIYSMSIRKFTKSIKRLDNYIHYKIYLAASMSGMYEFKDKSFIKHWLSNLDEEDKYKDVSIDMDEMQRKVSFESAKK